MQRRTFIRNSGAAALLGTTMVTQACTTDKKGLLGETQIQHGVIFNLKHEKGSPEAKKFLADGREILSGIPVVQNFQVFDQVSPKNDYQYGFTMVFDSMNDYNTYNEHPNHVAFVENRWMMEVTDFLEIDFKVQNQ
ncbi:MAG: Dabb family protein [Bacteroidales bacterium]|nr:Dabb family protein [Bacteroidales bacterium]